ncbi:MCE family protein [Mycobacteroides abscessus subsp. bolletii]|nr:MCE family protein [Mycobacteroides abscessus subsp. bolletii]
MRHIAISVITWLALTACTLDPAQLVLPSGSQTYPVRIQFATALNLPAGAKVVANGARVGRLDTVDIVDPAAGPGYVVAVVNIDNSVRLPLATRAQLRQDTILGDIYISLVTKTSENGAALPPGGTIPLEQTEPALQIEDILSGLATFVSGGALRSAQDVINQLNAALPQNSADTARIAGTLKADLIDVSANLETVDSFLDGLDAGVTAVQSNKAILDVLLTREGTDTTIRIAKSLIHTIGIIGAIGALADSLTWLAPFATELDAAAKAFVPLLLAKDRALNLRAPSNLNSLRALLREKLFPYFNEGSRTHINVTGIEIENADGQTSVTTEDQIEQIVTTLRMIGFVR